MQIKTRQRVRDLAEVYTHTREITAMLDMIPDMFPSEDEPNNTDHKFFEPSAGSGNFLEEILRRKISFITHERYRSSLQYEHRLLRAVASIYAVDIDSDNVAESKDRMRHLLQSHLDNDLNTKWPTSGFASAVDAILHTNVVQADTLADLNSLEWIDYRASRNGTFIREWSTAGEDAQRDLFYVPKLDRVALHYSMLADNPEPVTVPRKARV